MPVTQATVRRIGLAGRFTGAPILPMVSAVPVNPEAYPSSRAIGWGATGTGATASEPTWIAQDVASFTPTLIFTNINASDAPEGFICDPGTVDWPSVTRTGHLPRTPAGGVRRYAYTVGTSNLMNGVTTLWSDAVLEDRQMILNGNTLVECRKLPPLCTATSTTGTPLLYGFSALLTITSDITTTEARIIRWMGGFMNYAALGSDMDFYVVPFITGSLDVDIASAFYLNTLTDGTVSGADEALLISAGLTRYEFAWFLAVDVGVPSGPLLAPYSFISPTDIPPPYDCPGVDGMIEGGYYS